jgi:DNA-binding Lrp family transcriptional regulator
MSLTRRENFPQKPAPLPLPAKLLAEILLARAKGGECVISQAELCELSGFSRTTVWKYLNVLRERGIIDWERRKRLPKRYRFVDVNWVKRAPSPLKPEIAELVGKGQNVLILGEEGIGKTFQLSLLAQDGLPEASARLFLGRSTLRDALISLLEQLSEAGLFDVGSLSQPLSRLSAKELGSQVFSAVSRAKSRVFLACDDLDELPPALRRFLLGFLSLYNVQVVAAAKNEEKVKEFLDHFVVLRLQPLSEEETTEWVWNFIQARRIPVLGGEKGVRKLARSIFLRTGGNPRKIQAFLRKIEAQGYVDRRLLREELQVGRFQFLDMTWLIVLTAALAIATRYLSLGLHDRSLYLLAGLTYALALLLRWFSYRWRRK